MRLGKKSSGLPELRAARALLEQAQDRGPLRAAALCVWSAMFYRPEWSAELQARAAALEPLLFRYGAIAETVDKMNGQESAALRGSLNEFISAAEQELASSNDD
jgi:hypothetical protein